MSVVLRLQDITKDFVGVKALDGVTFDVNRSEVHVILGENGAGKSTLMKILAGLYRHYGGSIAVDGRGVQITTPKIAMGLGISMIHQELDLAPHLSVAQNIYLGREKRGRSRLFIDRRWMFAKAADMLSRIKGDIDPAQPVGSLSVAEQQVVAIARALSINAKIVIMDEPTSALTERETERLFQTIRTLKAEGVTIIYISHRLAEIRRIGDRATILRDGRYVATVSIDQATDDELVYMMVGRKVAQVERVSHVKTDSAPVLEVRHLRRLGAINDVSFCVYPGEILGLFGLMGAGRTELVRAIFGADRLTSGEVLVHGRRVRLNSPKDAIKVGIGFLPENRRTEGLFLSQSVADNICHANLEQISRTFLCQPWARDRFAEKFIKLLNIRTPSGRQRVKYLSGGNQQKVIMARWLAVSPTIVIFDEPTRGIDVGAKSEIHKLMEQLAEAGSAIIMVSSELPEILQMSDRILVMRMGRVVKEFSRQEATQEKILAAAMGKESDHV